MSDNKRMLKKLFTAHNADLLDTFADLDPEALPLIEDRILCPICLVGYPEEAIDTNELTDGHVWPESIRARSKAQQPHRVLLCAKCNHTSGSRGDKQMQLREKIKEEEDKGYYRERPIKLLGSDAGPIELNATLDVTEKDNVEIQARIHFSEGRNNPDEINRFKELSNKQDSFLNISMKAHPLIRPQVARVGWITAAYLACFRAFGYRYILHHLLNPVRQVILDSFENDEPVLHESNTLQVRICDEHDSNEPKISTVITLGDSSLPVYVQVDFWNYHIRLPMPICRFDVLAAMVTREIERGFVIPAGEDTVIGIGVECHKNSLLPDLHVCIWDYVLGKPD